MLRIHPTCWLEVGKPELRSPVGEALPQNMQRPELVYLISNVLADFLVSSRSIL